MRHTAIRVPKAAEIVAAALRRQIVRGELVEAEVLPSESTLMSRFGVSRPTLREAFRVLESEGLIQIRRGARGGARVHVPDEDVAARFAGLVLQHRGATVADVMETRALVEPPAAAMVARRRRDSDLAALRANLEATTQSLDETGLLPAHTEFHELVVELSGSRTLVLLTGMLHNLIESIWMAHRSALPTSEQRVREDETTVRAHRKLLTYLASGDADKAESFWRRHIRDSNAVLLEQIGSTTVLDLLGA